MITQPPLTNLQMELLQLYSLKLSDSELLQVKEILAKYYACRTPKARTKCEFVVYCKCFCML